MQITPLKKKKSSETAILRFSFKTQSSAQHPKL